MFINLYEFAVGKGLLNRELEFAQHFTSTAERFLTLAKAPVGDESPKDDEPVEDDNGKHRRSNSEQQPSNFLISPVEPSPAIIPSGSSMPHNTISTWGYQISHDAPSSEDVPSAAQNDFGFPQNGSELQLITQATPDNASFFDMMQPDLQQYRVDVPAMENYSQFFPQETLPLPKSFAYSEKTFARRLHREACQRGYKLITSPNPDPQRYKDVFSFSLRYTSKENIAARLKEIVFSSAKDSLQCW